MRKKIQLFCFLFLSCVGQIRSLEVPPELLKEIAPKEAVSIKDDEYFQHLINGNNQFAFDLYQQLKNKQGNLFISNYNIAIGMTMVGLGAQGETAQEMQKALHFSLNLSPLLHDLNQHLGSNADLKNSVQLSQIEALWLQQSLSLLPAYQIALKRSFDTSFHSVDFANPSQAFFSINNWVSQSTKGRINQMLSAQDLNKNTQFVLTTGFYWKGEWLQPFDRRNTVKAPFTYKGHPFQVQMMKQVSNYSILNTEKFDLVDIPFKSMEEGHSALSLTILLPKKDVDLSLLESTLNAQQWTQWIRELKEQIVELQLPKFWVDTSLDLNPLLKALGVHQAFEAGANFSGITEKEKIFLNKAVHKTSLRIDEAGSNGGMVAPVRDKTVVEKQAFVQVDRPFFFVIQDKETGLILCVGRIVQP